MRQAVIDGIEAAERDLSLSDAAAKLGTTGFIVHTLSICAYCFARPSESPIETIRSAILVGGDTDSHAAIVGGWLGAMHGVRAFPAALVHEIHDGPFGPSHLRGLSRALAEETPPPAWSWPAALLRNLCLFPVILAHGLIRLAR